MERPRVLVVEDNPGVLGLMAEILGDRYEVTTAGDGATAFSLLGSRAFEVVLTDVRMPGVTGFDVLRAVRAHASRACVVLMTAYANVPDAVAAMRQGAFDYVAKPLDADEISLVIARAVAHQRATARRADPEPPTPAPSRDEDGPRDISVGFHQAVEEARRRASIEYLEALMRHFHGNVTQAAEQAGMTRESLHRILRTYGIRSEPYREGGPGGGSPSGGPGSAATG